MALLSLVIQPQLPQEHIGMLSLARLYGVPSPHVESVWPHIEVFIEDALDYSDGKYSLTSIKQSLLDRQMQLWVMMDHKYRAAGVTSINDYPCKSVATVMFGGGEELSYFVEGIKGIEEWAKSAGCESLEVWGRPGWKKALNYELIHVVLRKNL